MTAESERSDSYEVVIRIDGGYEEEHAELLRKELIHDGFYEDVVSVRPIVEGENGE